MPEDADAPDHVGRSDLLHAIRSVRTPNASFSAAPRQLIFVRRLSRRLGTPK